METPAGPHRDRDAESNREKPSDSPSRRLLKERMRKPAMEAAHRVQKNLSLTRFDAERLSVLAQRDRLSQARILALALDCYENTYGSVVLDGDG